MNPKKYLFGQEAKQKLFKGIETLYKAVSSTLGPYGETVALDKRQVIHNTKDGVTVVWDIAVEDQFEEMGVKMVKEASDRSNYQSGDGTTSTIVIAYEFCKEWLKYNQKLNTIKVKRGMSQAIEVCVETIKNLSKKITKEEEFQRVGTISSQDSFIGEQVAKAYIMAGELGAIDIERGEEAGIEIEHTDGLSFDNGFMSAFFCNDPHNNRVVMEDVHVLVTDKIIKKEMQILPIMDALGKQGLKKLLIIAENVEGEAMGFLVQNLKVFHSCAVKAPSYGLSKIGIIDDICALTGATLLSESGGVRIEKASLEHLGMVKKAVVEKDRTVLVSSDTIEDKKRISDRIDQLKAGMKDEPSDTPKYEELQHRLATLTDGITILKVGAHSEGARHEYKARVEDAVRAVRSAAEEGVVPGGGTTYLRCIPAIDKLLEETKDEHEKIGISLVRKVLPSIALRVLEVAGIEDKEHIVAKVKEAKDWEGYNFENGKIEDMWELGILDASKVIRCALQNSASVASNFLSLGVAVSPVRDDIETVKAALGLDRIR